MRVDAVPDTASFLLSHHPSCGRFDHHVIRVMGRDVCLGCLFVYPSAVVTLLVLLLVLGPMLDISHVISLLLGLGLFIPAVVRRAFWKGLRNKAVHVAFRVDLGVSLGLALYSVLTAPAGMLRIAIALIVLGTVMMYQTAGWLALRATCSSCARYAEFPRCGPAT